MIIEQVNELRELIKDLRIIGKDRQDCKISVFSGVILQSADAIEILSSKLSTENTERSADCGDWIYCGDGNNLPECEYCEVLADIYDEEEDRHIMKVMTYENYGNCEYEFRNSFGLPQNVVAWQPLPKPYIRKDGTK